MPDAEGKKLADALLRILDPEVCWADFLQSQLSACTDVVIQEEEDEIAAPAAEQPELSALDTPKADFNKATGALLELLLELMQGKHMDDCRSLSQDNVKIVTCGLWSCPSCSERAKGLWDKALGVHQVPLLGRSVFWHQHQKCLHQRILASPEFDSNSHSFWFDWRGSCGKGTGLETGAGRAAQVHHLQRGSQVDERFFASCSARKWEGVVPFWAVEQQPSAYLCFSWSGNRNWQWTLDAALAAPSSPVEFCSRVCHKPHWSHWFLSSVRWSDARGETHSRGLLAQSCRNASSDLLTHQLLSVNRLPFAKTVYIVFNDVLLLARKNLVLTQSQTEEIFIHLYRWMRSSSRPHQKGSAEFQKGWDGCYQISSTAQQAQDSKEGEFTSCGEATAFQNTYSGVAFRPASELPLITCAGESQNLPLLLPPRYQQPHKLGRCAHRWCAFVLARRQAHQLLLGHLRWVQSEGSLWCDSWLRSYDGSLHHQRCSVPWAVPEPWAHAVVAGSGGQSCLWAHFDPRFHLAFWRAGKICKAVFCGCVAELNPLLMPMLKKNLWNLRAMRDDRLPPRC